MTPSWGGIGGVLVLSDGSVRAITWRLFIARVLLRVALYCGRLDSARELLIRWAIDVAWPDLGLGLRS